MANKKRRDVQKTSSGTPAQTKQEVFYPMNSIMNGVATAFFAVVTVIFPLLIGSQKYGAITKFKKTSFIIIAVVMICTAAIAFMLSYTTTPKKSNKAAGAQSDEVSVSLFAKRLTAAQVLFGAAAAMAFFLALVTSATLAMGLAFVLFMTGLVAVSLMKSGSQPKSASLSKGGLLSTVTLADIAIVAYWLLMNISAFCSDDPFFSIVGLEKRNNGVFIQTLYILMYFVISRGIVLSGLKMRMYTWGGLAVSVIAIFHYFGIDILKTGFGEARWKVEMIADKQTRVSKGMNFLGSIGNINLLSYVIVICLVVTIMLYIVKGTPKWDKAGISIIASCFVMSFAERCTRTDAGIVALLGAGAFAVLVMCSSMERLRRICLSFGVSLLGWWLHMYVVEYLLQHKRFGTTQKAVLCGGIMLCVMSVVLLLLKDITANIKGKYVHIGAIAFVCLGGVGACLLALNAAKTQTEGTFYEFGQMLSGHFEDKYGNGRVKIWRNTVKLIDENPLFGIGPDRFSDIFKEKIGVLFPGKNLDKAHNEYLDVLVCNGILGLGAFLAFLGGLLARAVKNAKRYPAAGIFAVAMAAYMVHAFFGYQLPIQSPVVWAMLGMAGAACNGACYDIPSEEA